MAGCPRGIIRHQADVPWLDLATAGCDGCGECVDACPQGTVLQPLAAVAVLDPGACFAWKGVLCTSCAHVCPRGAVALDGRRRPSLDAALCTGCGLCLGPCPADAIEVVLL